MTSAPRVSLHATLRPVDHIPPPVLAQGLRIGLYDTICSQAMSTFGAAPFLVAIALSLGSSTMVIGLITALGPLAQLVQLPAMRIIELAQRRKLIVVLIVALSRVFWVGIAAAPFIAPVAWRIPLFLASLFWMYLFGSISLLAYNMWMRDLVPEPIRGEYNGHRAAIATLVGAALSIALGVGADVYGNYRDRVELLSLYLLVAAAIGFLGCWFLARIPEPRMRKPPTSSLHVALRAPFLDSNYRALVWFLSGWSFAINLALPFFAVFMLERLHLSLGWIMGLSVFSQGGSVFFLRLWGRLADRFSNLAVLRIVGPVFLIALLMWALLPQVPWPALVILLLILLHIVAGAAMAGVGMVTGNMAMKLAPPERSGPYLAVVATMTGIAATLAPVLVGLFARAFEQGGVASPGHIVLAHVAGYDIGLLDGVYVATVVLGALSLRLLKSIDEPGDEHPAIVRALLFRLLRAGWRRSFGVQGFVALMHFPYASVAAAKGTRFGEVYAREPADNDGTWRVRSEGDLLERSPDRD